MVTVFDPFASGISKVSGGITITLSTATEGQTNSGIFYKVTRITASHTIVNSNN